MSKIKFEVEIDATNGQHVLAVTNFLLAIGDTAEAITHAPKKEVAKATTKADELPKKEKAKAEDSPEEAPKEETEKEKAPKTKKVEDSIDIVKVRALLATKVGDHRTEIKNELTRLGATSVSTLDPKHYQEFADFLNSL